MAAVDGYRLIVEKAEPRKESDDDESPRRDGHKGGRRGGFGFGGGFGGRRRREDRRDGRDFREGYSDSPRPNRAERRHRDRGGKQK